MDTNREQTDPKPVQENMDYFKKEYPNIFEEIHFKSSHAYEPYVLLEKPPVREYLQSCRFILTQAGIVTMTTEKDFYAIWEINGRQRNIIETINNFANIQQDFFYSNRGIQDSYLHIPGEEKIKLSFTPYVEDIKDSSLISALEDMHKYDNEGDTFAE